MFSNNVTNQKKFEEFTRHKHFLQKIRKASLYCPRYDMLSQTNNLLLHINYDPKKELLPKKESEQIRRIEQQIRNYQQQRLSKPKELTRWYEQVMNRQVVTQKKINFEYAQVNAVSATDVRQKINKIYKSNMRIKSLKKSINQSYSNRTNRQSAL